MGDTTSVKSCDCLGCESTFQDKQYGIGRRLHNKSMKGWRCTVCGNLKLTP